MLPGNGVRRDKLSKAFQPNSPKTVINRNVISTGPVGSRVPVSILIYLWNFYRALSEVLKLYIELDELVLVSLSSVRFVCIRSDDIAKGVSPRTFSINHLCGFDISFVVCTLSFDPFRNPSLSPVSIVSIFRTLVNIIKDIHAAKSPVAHPANKDTPNGKVKSITIPNGLFTYSSSSRGIFSMNVPNTRRAIIRNTVPGK